MNALHQRRRYRCNKRAEISHRSTFAGGRAFRWFLAGVVPTRRTLQPSAIISRWERRIRSNPRGLSGSRNRSGLWLWRYRCPFHLLPLPSRPSLARTTLEPVSIAANNRVEQRLFFLLFLLCPVCSRFAALNHRVLGVHPATEGERTY